MYTWRKKKRTWTWWYSAAERTWATRGSRLLTGSCSCWLPSRYYISRHTYFSASLYLSTIAIFVNSFFLLSLRLILLLVCVNSRIADMLSSSCPDTWNPTKSFLHLHTAYMYSPRVKKKVCVCLLQQRKRDPTHIYIAKERAGEQTRTRVPSDS